MAKIKVTSKCELYDGMSITFRAPCDGTAVDGLNVYYNNAARSFAFRDAHGNTMAGLDNLFSEGVYIKTILDTTNNYAYLQNADSNAYLESRLGGSYSLSETLQDDTKALYGLSTAATPDDVFAFIAPLIVPRVTVTVDTGAVVTATMGNLTVTGVSVNGAATLYLNSMGEWTFTATLNGAVSSTATVDVQEVQEYKATLVFLDDTLANNSWAKISLASKLGVIPDAWKVGDTKTFTTTTGYTYTARIIDFGKDVDENDNIIGITFEVVECYPTAVAMWSSALRVGTWADTKARSILTDTLLPTLPTDLQDAIVPTKKGNGTRYYDENNATQWGEDYFIDKLWIISRYEAGGTYASSSAPDSEKKFVYAYYTDNSTRIKYKNGASSATGWYTRTWMTNGYNYLCTYVFESDGTSTGTAYVQTTNSSGLAFWFCI